MGQKVARRLRSRCERVIAAQRGAGSARRGPAQETAHPAQGPPAAAQGAAPMDRPDQKSFVIVFLYRFSLSFSLILLSFSIVINLY